MEETLEAKDSKRNLDPEVVAGFGDEWTRFDQSRISASEIRQNFDEYFSIFPWEKIGSESVGFDLGCGSGRWAALVAPRVGHLHLIDASNDALGVSRRNLSSRSNCSFHNASVDAIPLADASCDFGYSLGVLHHIPDTEAGLRSCVAKLKKGAPFLVYLYYAFDNRPPWFRWIWKLSEFGRKVVSRLPHSIRSIAADMIAALVYFPFARFARLVEKLGFNADNLPLSKYRTSSFYTMRNDSLDRFGTRLEQRFTAVQIRSMMETCGLENISFGPQPYWTAVGYKT